ncbi:MarR family transcriptional regulator [Phytohabitans sp. ZYX-F-186]|uniref:MarR family transcriptional regulator n=1 Tax=Phytohabitans maris TaxID=3071409 RepID=A0ABU0ZTQ3_9ACTN|nr:MarR family transcriptional regulator [Phytohabitans sp. ZYX-F-186]MDQ7910423.1 MarR family transcriptional regulator [Phytohabitans sp. ZYX-F-186]
MAEPTRSEREFVERIGMFFETLGTARMMGRIYGWLMIAPQPRQSITELAAALGASKASISTVIRQLELGQLVERVPVPGSRQHHYQLRSGGWAHILRARVARLRPGIEAAQFGLTIVGDDRPGQRERLYELMDFFDFVGVEYGEEHVRRWEEYAKQGRDRRAGERS